MKNQHCSSRSLEAIEFALKSLTVKRQSEREMRDKIRRRFPDADVEAVISRLIELDYLDDQAFAAAFVRHRSLSSPRGSYTLRQELKRKGIADIDMEEALEDYKAEEGAVLEALAQKKWLKIKEQNAFKKRTKLQQFLMSRGFAISDVIEVVNAVAQEPDEC